MKSVEAKGRVNAGMTMKDRLDRRCETTIYPTPPLIRINPITSSTTIQKQTPTQTHKITLQLIYCTVSLQFTFFSYIRSPNQ